LSPPAASLGAKASKSLAADVHGHATLLCQSLFTGLVSLDQFVPREVAPSGMVA
jgi:hypothetical protein